MALLAPCTPVVAKPKLQPHPHPQSSAESPFLVTAQSPRLSDRRRAGCLRLRSRGSPGKSPVLALGKSEPLRVMISGAPASGKGTQLWLDPHCCWGSPEG